MELIIDLLFKKPYTLPKVNNKAGLKKLATIETGRHPNFSGPMYPPKCGLVGTHQPEYPCIPYSSN